MIIVELNAEGEPCLRCGHKNTVYVCQSLLLSIANCYQLTINLFCVKCGHIRVVSAKVEIADEQADISISRGTAVEHAGEEVN